MKRIEDLIKWILLVWAAYPFASFFSYFAANGLQLFEWGICAIICAAFTLALIIAYLIIKVKEKYQKDESLTYDKFKSSIHQIIHFTLQYRNYRIEMNKANDEFVCQIYQNNQDYIEKIFRDYKTLFSFPFFENKSIEEFWDYSIVTVEFIEDNQNQ